MKYTCSHCVFGVAVAFHSNSGEIGRWVDLAFPDSRPVPEDIPVVLRVGIEVTPAERAYLRQVFHYRIDEPVLRASNDHARMVADGSTGAAMARISDALLRDEDFLSREIVECLTRFLISWRGRFPIHATALRDGETTLLLTGRSGAGKSSLAYACWKAGWRVVSEDMVLLDTTSAQPRIWSSLKAIHLLESAVGLFPELAGLTLLELPNGKRKYRIPVGAGDDGPYGNLRLCVVRPGHDCGDSRWQLCADASVLDAFADSKDSGFDLRFDNRSRARALLEKLPVFELAVGNDMQGAQRAILEIVNA